MSTTSWVDLQVNGYIGVDFSSPRLTAEDFLRAADAMLNSGTGIFLPTVITSRRSLYQRNLPLIVEAVERHGLTKHIPGLHLEGPFLANTPGYVGCHNPKYTLPPLQTYFDELYNLSAGKLKLITLAATPAATGLISYISQKNVVVSLGHHNAGMDNLDSAATAGAKLLTHLGNGIPNQIARHNNPVFAGLAEDALTAMVITDGHHLPANVIKCFLRCKTADRFIVVSDASPAAGLPPGRYNVLGNDAILDESGKLYNPVKECLVGSAANLSDCMKFLASLNLLTPEELIKVGRTNALKMIGLADE